MKYRVLKRIGNDKLREAYIPGAEVSLKGWGKKNIDHLLAKGAIEVIKPDKAVSNG